jgi:pimeloyl-ACP methyl ester carboxylesterase
MSAYRTETVVSADGTQIGFRKIGHGPGLVLVQGAMGTAWNYDELASALSSSFTVYLPDRRGRGMSPLSYAPTHVIDRDVEDLEALLLHSGARFVFGLSSGAIITLAATAALPAIVKAAIYEPPFSPKGISPRLVRRFNREVTRGRLADALLTAGKIVKLARLLRFIPRFVGRFATGATLKREARSGSGQYAPLRLLIPAMRYDFKVVATVGGNAHDYTTLDKPILLLGGDRSPKYLTEALIDLDGILPNADIIEFKGLDHSGPWNADRGGQPELVASALRNFFLV